MSLDKFVHDNNEVFTFIDEKKYEIKLQRTKDTCLALEIFKIELLDSVINNINYEFPELKKAIENNQYFNIKKSIETLSFFYKLLIESFNNKIEYFINDKIFYNTLCIIIDKLNSLYLYSLSYK